MNFHYLITKGFLQKGFAPTLAEMAAEAGLPPAEAEAALRDLADSHGVVLHPHCPEVWICHPFATYPMGWWVEQGGRGWFSNCAWCALGVSALVGGARVHTFLAGEKENVSFDVSPSGPEDSGHVVHFAVPPKRAWDNVLFTCGTITLFAKAADVDGWCRRHRLPRGEVVSLHQAWRLASAWYGRHAAPDWKKWTVVEAAAIFKNAGLVSPFWSLEGTGAGGRF